jgi:putative acetyltransferase
MAAVERVDHDAQLMISTSPMQIRLDDLTGPQIHALLDEHLRNMHEVSPPEISFWTAWSGDELLGCGALKQLGPDHGEIKSMRTALAHLRKGAATALLRHIVQEAQRRGYTRLSLETGSMVAFGPARKLYASFGFRHCGPFAEYVDDPNSIFMTRRL